MGGWRQEEQTLSDLPPMPPVLILMTTVLTTVTATVVPGSSQGLPWPLKSPSLSVSWDHSPSLPRAQQECGAYGAVHTPHFCWVALEEAFPGIQLELLLVSNRLDREWVFPCHSNARQAQMLILCCACMCIGECTCICRYSHTCMYVHNGYTCLQVRVHVWRMHMCMRMSTVFGLGC